jgi:AMMECR1 domain-containing protein
MNLKKKGVSKYASVAAFEDTRFNPIALSEVEVFFSFFFRGHILPL